MPDRKSTRLNSSHGSISYAVSLDRSETRLNSSHDSILYAVSLDRKSTRLNSSHGSISYAVFCLKKKKKTTVSSRQVYTSKARHASCAATHTHTAVCAVLARSIHVLLRVFYHFVFFFFFNDTATTEIYTLSLHDALPI